MTSAEHAATVREAHDTLIEACWSPDDVAEWVASLASLVALAERATELEDRLADGRDYELSIERDLADVRETLQAIRLALIDNDPEDALAIARAALGETAP